MNIFFEYLHQDRQRTWQAYERFRSAHHLFDEHGTSLGLMSQVRDYILGYITVSSPSRSVAVDAAIVTKPTPTPGHQKRAS